MNGPLVRALARIARPTPAQEWLESIDFDALKAKWAAQEAAETTEYLNEVARRSAERVRAVLGEA